MYPLERTDNQEGTQHVLVLTQNDVEIPMYGGALRVASLITYMRSQGVRVSVIRLRTKQERPSEMASGIYDLIVPPLYSLSPIAALWQLCMKAIDRTARRIHAAHPLTIIQSDPPWPSLAGQRIAGALSVPHVVLSQNCETALATQFSASGPARKIPFIGGAIASFNIAVLRWAEKHAIEDATLAFTPSQSDIEEMTSAGIDATRVRILPNGTSVRRLPENARTETRARLGIAAEAPVVIFLGRMDYPPNLQAVFAIRDHIAPLCSGVRFLLVGSNPPKLDLPGNACMVGRVDSVDEYLRAADIAIVPIEQGSGTRIKILDAWAAGLPVISTSAGASGIGYQHQENMFIEDEIAAFPARISELLADPDLLRHIGLGALAAVEPYRWDTIAPTYLNAIIGLAQPLEKRQMAAELV